MVTIATPKSTDTICAPECQESIDKLESVCNPTGGPIGTYTTTADDDVDHHPGDLQLGQYGGN